MEISFVISGEVKQSRKTVVSFSQDDIYMWHSAIHLLLGIHKLSGRFEFFFLSFIFWDGDYAAWTSG